MTCITQILVALLIGYAAREFSFNQSEALTRSGSARHQYGISALFTQTSFYEGSSGDLGCFLRIRIMRLVSKETGAVSVEK